MSLKKNATEWLYSQNKFSDQDQPLVRRAKTISITSGKGGVGKTSVSLKMAKLMAQEGHKVLLIDCDYNLSNTAVKLGLPISGHFHSLITCEKSFDECLYRDGNFHLLSGCNGNIDLFKKGLELDRIIIDIIVGHEQDYDFILLDCPAGITKDTLTLNAYSDYRFVVVTPDKSSITDSYSLIKILKNEYGIKLNHLLINKVSTIKQYQRIVKSLSETVENFLQIQLKVLGGIRKEDLSVDKFDEFLLGGENSSLHRNFVKFIKRFTEEGIGTPSLTNGAGENFLPILDGLEQDVQPTVS